MRPIAVGNSQSSSDAPVRSAPGLTASFAAPTGPYDRQGGDTAGYSAFEMKIDIRDLESRRDLDPCPLPLGKPLAVQECPVSGAGRTFAQEPAAPVVAQLGMAMRYLRLAAERQA